jgi:hypothetical protein
MHIKYEKERRERLRRERAERVRKMREEAFHKKKVAAATTVQAGWRAKMGRRNGQWEL